MSDSVKEILVEFKDFMLGQIDDRATYNGIYYVCAMRRIQNTGNSCFSRLLYVGKSSEEKGIYGRYLGHDDKERWISSLTEGEYIGFFTAEINNDVDLLRVEAALIYAFKPPLNVQGKETFGYPITRIIISNIWGLKKSTELLGRYTIENKAPENKDPES